jgi:hypothetical protein
MSESVIDGSAITGDKLANLRHDNHQAGSLLRLAWIERSTRKTLIGPAYRLGFLKRVKQMRAAIGL